MWPRSWPRLGAQSCLPKDETVKVSSQDSYEHGLRAGNRGDVWKHFLLLTALEILTRQEIRQPEPFRYLETHCGEALYLLGKGGAWREGVGRLRPPPASLISHPYFRLVGMVRGPGGVYPASWLQAALFLQGRGLHYRMGLYDTSPKVREHLRALGISEGAGTSISFACKDGFEGLAGSGETWDLALVDPPFWPDAEKDRRKCSAIMSMLKETCRLFLVWYPLFSETDPGIPLARGCQALEILWCGEKGASSMCGCGVLVGGRVHGIPGELFPWLEQLALRLGASFRWRKA